MPIPKPNKGEKKKDYVSRCIASEISAGVEQSQAAAICHSQWDDSRKKGRSKDTGSRTIKYKKM